MAETDSDGWTALHCAVSSGHAEICWVLLAAGAETDVRTLSYGLSAETETLVQSSHISGGKSLARGNTPLDYAAERGHAEVCRMLLAAGAEVNGRDGGGLSAVKMMETVLRGDNYKLHIFETFSASDEPWMCAF